MKYHSQYIRIALSPTASSMSDRVLFPVVHKSFY